MEKLMCMYENLATSKALCTFDRESTEEPDDCAFNCENICRMHQDNTCQGCPLQEVFERLKAYEDTNHTPEEIAEFDKLYLEKCEEVNRLTEELQKMRESDGD